MSALQLGPYAQHGLTWISAQLEPNAQRQLYWNGCHLEMHSIDQPWIGRVRRLSMHMYYSRRLEAVLILHEQF